MNGKDAVLRALVALAFFALPAPAIAASIYAGSSPDGSRVFFESEDPLVPQDTDALTDVYAKSGGLVRLLSTSAAAQGGGVAGFRAISADGGVVVFHSTERLVAADADDGSDVYMRSGPGLAHLTLVTPSGDATFNGLSADGTKVTFSTDGIDDDGKVDIFRWTAEGTTMLTPGTAEDVVPIGATPDLAHVYFESAEDGLGGSEADGGRTDVFDAGPSPTWLSVPAVAGDDADVHFAAATADGSKVFLATTQRMTATDDDAGCPPGDCGDVFRRAAGVTTLISTGPGDGHNTGGHFLGMSADGTRVFFGSRHAMATDDDVNDTDSGGNPAYDIYARSGDATTLITPNTWDSVEWGGASADGSKVFFESYDYLPGDQDSQQDVFQRSGGTTTLLSGGATPASGQYNAFFDASTPDGGTVWITTREPLTADDTDSPATVESCFNPSCTDVFARSGATTTLLSLPGADAAPGAGDAEAWFRGATPDGSHVFFSSPGALTAADTFPGYDVYERAGGVTTLLAGGTPAPPFTAEEEAGGSGGDDGGTGGDDGGSGGDDGGTGGDDGGSGGDTGGTGGDTGGSDERAPTTTTSTFAPTTTPLGPEPLPPLPAPPPDGRGDGTPSAQRTADAIAGSAKSADSAIVVSGTTAGGVIEFIGMVQGGGSRRAERAARIRAFRVRSTVPAGRFRVRLRPTGTAKRLLHRGARLRIALTVRFTPAGTTTAAASTRTLTLKLRARRR
ncbi:MAG TPA: hypothetical protein VF549_12770 [Solirubrobacteraceae bacterium]